MRYLIFIIVFLVGCTNFNAAHFLNDAELVSESTPKAPPLNVRIYKLEEHGECISDTCILGKLYIAVSEYGEYPSQKYFVAPLKPNWKFIKWLKSAQFSEENPTAIFSVSYEENNIVYTENMHVNLDGITYRDNKRMKNDK